MSNRLGDAPIEAEYRETMNMVAAGIDHMFNGDAKGADKRVGFILMVFPFDGHEGRANYISNARREDVVILLREQLTRFQGQAEMKGTA